MKKTVAIIVSVLCALINIQPVYAENTDENANGFGNPSKAEIAENEAIISEKEAVSNEITPFVANVSKALNVPMYKQEQNTWCGPASVQMVVKYVDGRYFSQANIAAWMGTDSTGTYVYRIAQELNTYNGISGYGWSNIKQRDLWTTVKTSINSNRPAIAKVFTQKINKNYSFYSGHYVVIKGYSSIGYDEGTTPAPMSLGTLSYDTITPFAIVYLDQITYIDPWKDNNIFGQRTVASELFRNAMLNSAGDGYIIW